MRIVALGPNIEPSKVVGAFHSRIFDGEVYDSLGKTISGFDANRYNTTTPIVSHLTRSWPDPAKICMPSGTLLIEETISRSLEIFSSVRTFETKLEKVVRVSLSKGDFRGLDSLLKQYDEVDFDEVYPQLPDCPELHDQVNRFREVVAIRHKDIVDEFQHVTLCKVYPLSKSYKDSMVRANFSALMFEKYPVISLNSLTVFSESAFKVISPHLDTDYFFLQYFDVA